MLAIPILDDKIVKTTINGAEVEFLYNTYATSAISKKFGGLEKMKEVLSADSPDLFDGLAYVMTALINGAVIYRNLYGGEKQEKIPEEYLLATTTLADLTAAEDDMGRAFALGSGRTIESETEKNTTAE
jgi:hypothetical protein